MKCKLAVLLPAVVLAVAITPNYTLAQSVYAVVERGPDWRVWESTNIINGTNAVHRYTELATGIHYRDSSGQWAESREEISILPQGGAAAVFGRHQVYFPADIGSGVLEVVTPDGRVLQSRPLGVTYDDTKNTVFIGVLTNSVGWQTASNQVTYRDCFTGIHADLVCTYRRGWFECDLVIREKPPAPDVYGLSDADSKVQLVTEFFHTQDPQRIRSAHDDRFGLQDETLKFGKMTMGQGKAFAANHLNSQVPSANSRTRVYKSWLHLQGRTFLIEQVPLIYVANELNALPSTSRIETPGNGNLKFASNALEFPPAREIVTGTNQIQIAAADLNPHRGMVLDYNILDSDQTDYTFEEGQTYLVSGSVNLGDGSENRSSVIFQGGAVIKFTSDASNGINYDPNDASYPTSPDLPAILTSKDDDSVGAQIDGSTGNPITLTNVMYLPNVGGGDGPANLDIYYAGVGMAPGDPCPLLNCRFFNCNDAILMGWGEVDLYNCLFSQCTKVIYWCQDGGYYDQNGNWQEYDGASYMSTIINITADQIGQFCQWPAGGWDDSQVSIYLYNSIFTQVSDYWGLNSLFFYTAIP